MTEETHPAERAVVEELRAIAQEVERVPHIDDIAEHASFSPATVRDVFGSLAGAHLAAGFEPTTVRGLPDELLANELRAVAEELGRPPARTEFDAHSVLPSAGYTSRWGSWNDALRHAGLEVNRDSPSDATREDAITAVRETGEHLGRTPTIEEVVDHTEATRYLVTERYDRFAVLVAKAGFDPTHKPVRTREREATTD